jgi:hypothetical protein
MEIWPANMAQKTWWYTTPSVTPGTEVSITIGALDNLTTNTVYAWRAQTADGIDLSPWSGFCWFGIDKSAPALPRITLDASNVYEVGRTIKFSFANGGSSDVTQYWWSLNNSAVTQGPVSASSPTAQATLTSFGPVTLSVQSGDAAGHRSLTAGTSLSVVWNGVEKNRWKLDERSGTTAADTANGGTGPNPLALVDGASFVPAGAGGGVAGDFDPNDGALQFNGTSDGNANSGSAQGLVDDRDNWSVMGWLRPGFSTVKRSAISQDGDAGATFAIGTVPVQVPQEDGTTVTQQRFAVTIRKPGSTVDLELVNHDVPVEPDHWYYVAAVHDASNRTINLHVISDDSGYISPPVGLSLQGVSLWPTRSQFRIGLAKRSDGRPADDWLGRVGDVVHLKGAATDDVIQRYATGG